MGFFRALFDLSFREYVVVRVVRVMYVLLLVAAVLLLLGMVVGGVMSIVQAQQDLSAAAATTDMPLSALHEASSRQTMGIAMVVAAPFAAFLLVLWGRVVAELTVVVFAIAESLKR